jgi:hypothetical protein
VNVKQAPEGNRRNCADNGECVVVLWQCVAIGSTCKVCVALVAETVTYLV